MSSDGPVAGGTVVLLHGGRPAGGQVVGPRYVPCRVIRSLHRAVRGEVERQGWSTRVLINRFRGWRVPGESRVVAVEDAVAALAPTAGPVVLVGHSMGARVALRVAARLSGSGVRVVGVIGLAPWLPARDRLPLATPAPPYPITLISGTLDPLAPPASVALAAARHPGADVRTHTVAGGEHALLVRRSHWLTLTRDALDAMITGAEGGQSSVSLPSVAVRASIRASAPSRRC